MKIWLLPGPFGRVLPNISEDEPVGHPFEGIWVEETSQEDSRLGIILFQISLVKTLNLLCGQELCIHDGVHEIIFA